MSDNNTQNNTPATTNTTSSGSTLTAQPVRIIDNAAIRERQREERGKSKELSRKKQVKREKAAARKREKENKKQLQYAREYIAKNNRPPLTKPVLDKVQAEALRAKFGELPAGPQDKDS